MIVQSLTTVKKRRKFHYPVIWNFKRKTGAIIRENLEFVLDYWPLYESRVESHILNLPVLYAYSSKMYCGSSPVLSFRRLFMVWRMGKLIHPSFCDEQGNVINENLYQVGISYSTPEYYVVWGIVPSLKTVVVGKPPIIREIADIEANLRVYYEITGTAGKGGHSWEMRRRVN